MKIIVDSNILFSAILNTNSRYWSSFNRGGAFFDFYGPKYARTEILRHQNKIKEIARMSDEEFLEAYELVFKIITILNHSILPEKHFRKAIEYCQDVDLDDAMFVGFSEYLNSKLWTGDKKLITGLKTKKFERIITTEEIYKEFLRRRNLQR